MTSPSAAAAELQHDGGLAIPVPAMATARRDTISGTFSKLREQRKVALIPFVVAGDPDLETTSKALRVLDSSGADVIELGLPFSDPVMDGPVIQDAHKRALAKGADFDGVISMLKEVLPQISAPIVLFTYYSPVQQYGVEKFLATMQNAGVKGLLVPDASFEESETLRTAAANHDIEMVLITTPSTSTERMKSIVQASRGFVYLVSTDGVTGARATVDVRVKSLIEEVKGATDTAVAVGFGISQPEHAKQVADWGANGMIVGSAMVKKMFETSSTEDGLQQLEIFVKSLKAALP